MLIFIIIFAGLGAYILVRSFADTATPISPLHISGNQILDGNNNIVKLHGVDRSGTEYMCSEGYGIFDGPTGSAEFAPMAKWDINSVYMGLNEDCWLGINGSGINNWAADSGQNYIDAIKSEVASAESYGIHPVIAFYWGDPGTIVSTGNDPNGGGQPPLPDNDHTPLFWEEVADTFKNDSNVIFRLQEEPHPGNVGTDLATWQCWSQGDVQYGTASVNAYGTAPTPVSSNSHCTEKDTQNTAAYQTVGMQSLINIIRGTGANNIIQVPGVAYANMLACTSTGSPSSCGFLDSTDGVKLSDPTNSSYGSQLMADLDMYPDNGQICDTTTCYNDTIAPVAAIMPVDLGEIGPNGSVDTQSMALLSWMDSQNQSNYYAWAWDTWANLIGGYGSATTSATPKSPWGTDYYDLLTNYVPPPPTQPANSIVFRQTSAQSCTNPPSSTVALSQAVSAGDDLFVVVGGGGYTSAASVVTSVSDSVNGSWTQLANTGSQAQGNDNVSYAVYELINSKAAASGLTITINGSWGQSGMSAVALDVGGVASVRSSVFDSAINASNTAFTSTKTLSGVQANDVVLGLYGNYSHSGDSFSAPSGWNTSATNTYWISSQNCAGAATDWTQPSASGSVTPSIISSGAEEYYAGGLDLVPASGGTTNAYDLNSDGKVDSSDVTIFQGHWNSTGTGLPEDFNSDGKVNIFDLSELLSHYGP